MCGDGGLGNGERGRWRKEGGDGEIISDDDSGGRIASVVVQAGHQANSGYALISTRACQAIGGMAAAALLAGAAASTLI